MNEDKTQTTDVGFLRHLFLTHEDSARCFGSLSKLARHLAEPVVITGSIAIGWHLLKSGRQLKKRHLNDIDTVAVRGLYNISPSLSQDFLINHFHPYRERGKVLLQLVDEDHGTRTELFTSNSDSLEERLTSCAIGELSCRIVSVEDILAKLLSIIHAVIEDKPVDPKYVEHFDWLLTIADMSILKEVWINYRKESQSADFDEAAEAIRWSIAAKPNLLQATVYCQHIHFTCAWCQASELFPVSSRSKVYEILGYV